MEWKHKGYDIYVSQDGTFCSRVNEETVCESSLDAIRKAITKSIKKAGKRVRVLVSNWKGLAEGTVTSKSAKGSGFFVTTADGLRAKEYIESLFHFEPDKIAECNAIQDEIDKLEKKAKELRNGIAYTEEELLKEMGVS